MNDAEKKLYASLLNEADTVIASMSGLEADSEEYKKMVVNLAAIVRQLDTLKTLELSSRKEELDEQKFEFEQKKFEHENELNNIKHELDVRRLELDVQKLEFEAQKQKKEDTKAYVNLGVQAVTDTAKVVVPAIVAVGAAQAMTSLEKEGVYCSGSAGKIFLSLITKIR